MEEGEINEVGAAHAMADTDEGARHLGTEVVDH